MSDKRYPTRMHEVLTKPGELPLQTGEIFTINEDDHGFYHMLDCEGQIIFADQEDAKEYRITADMVTSAINNGIIRKPRPGCWHCWNIEAHKIKYVTAVKDKGGRPMNTPTDIPYRYCPSCGRKLEVEV